MRAAGASDQQSHQEDALIRDNDDEVEAVEPTAYLGFDIAAEVSGAILERKKERKIERFV